MQRPQFATGHIYHLYNRGVEKRDIFLDDQDHLRCIHDLYEFNDEDNVPPSNIRFALRKPSTLESRQILRQIETAPLLPAKKKRKLLVEIFAFCLMPNHFHLLVRQLRENGIVRFMQKLGTGYAMYFNQKYERVGALFQGRFKAVLVEREPHFLYLPYYIEVISKPPKNPLFFERSREVPRGEAIVVLDKLEQ